MLCRKQSYQLWRKGAKVAPFDHIFICGTKKAPQFEQHEWCVGAETVIKKLLQPKLEK